MPKNRKNQPRPSNSGHGVVFKDETVEELEQLLLATVREAAAAAVDQALDDLFRRLHGDFDRLATDLRAALAGITDRMDRLEKSVVSAYASERDTLPETAQASPAATSNGKLEKMKTVPRDMFRRAPSGFNITRKLEEIEPLPCDAGDTALNEESNESLWKRRFNLQATAIRDTTLNENRLQQPPRSQSNRRSSRSVARQEDGVRWGTPGTKRGRRLRRKGKRKP